MIEVVINKIWNMLKRKEISLAMIYDRDGKILWHKGRDINGHTIDSGDGFCRNYIEAYFNQLEEKEKGRAITDLPADSLSRNITIPPIKSLHIHPLNSKYFLYIDSYVDQAFIDSELTALKSMSTILAETIGWKMEMEMDGICGESEVMKKIKKQIMNYAMEEEPVLLLGETGVGKSHIARLIHLHSKREGKFVVADAPTLQENLFESILFGHKKGAFTDAKFDNKGLLEEANDGTLLIDEVSEIPITLQAKFLRFIESKKYRILGESLEKQANVRIIAASNRNLFKAIEDKEFREDLYYRLNILEISIPPLRERKEDIEIFIKENRHLLKDKAIGDGFMNAIFNHDWPGNFRELITVLKRAGICFESPITGKNIKDIINQTTANNISQKHNGKIDQIWHALTSGGTFWEVVKKPFLKRDLNRCEVKEIINRGLTPAQGKYKSLIKIFNLSDEDYHKFMTFLREYKLR
jgi:transcriptional regulator with PAS, ATPase and Fis domain